MRPVRASGLGWTVGARATWAMPRPYIAEPRARPQLLITDGLAFKQGTWKEAVGPHWAWLQCQISLGSLRRCQELEREQVGAVSSVYSGVRLPGFAYG